MKILNEKSLVLKNKEDEDEKKKKLKLDKEVFKIN